jgi:hypothetical protein
MDTAFGWLRGYARADNRRLGDVATAAVQIDWFARIAVRRALLAFIDHHLDGWRSSGH